MKKKTNPVSRRNFLGTISKATVLGGIGVTGLPALAHAAEKNKVDATTHCFLTRPYIHSSDPGTMYIRWITGKNSYSWVEYGEGAELNLKAHAVTDGLVDANNCIHEVTLASLKPGTVYQYRVASKEIKDFQPYKLTYGETIYSDTYSFTTFRQAAEEIQWLILNDIHDRPQSFEQLIKVNGNEPYDYVYLNGDMFDYQTDQQQIIDHLITPCTNAFATQKPMLFLRGNHETRGKYARQLKAYFSYPNGQYFSFHLGPVFAIALDTGEDKEDTHAVYAGIVDFDHYRLQQAAWLEEQMQSKAYRNARFRVVMMHIPPFYSGDAHGVMHCRALFSPLFDKHKVDLVIAGHTHAYGVYPPVPGKHKYPLIIGGGPQDGLRTVINIKATAQTLNLKMLRDDGVEVGSYQVTAAR
ncbi:MAG: metallophosphoesterase family protein [Bacteroidota bacterium]